MTSLRRLLFLFLLMASPTMAQRILIITGGTVTGNVTDSADFLVTLNQNVTGVTLTSTVMPATGYIVSMKFVQDATGSRTVAFGGNISTACAVNSTALAVTICRWQYTASSNAWADAAGGAAAVSSLPATCTPGTTAPVNLTINGIGYGVFYCSATNVFTPSNPTNTVSPLAYGALADTHVLTSTTVSWTGATSTATVTATSSVFLPTDCAGGSGCTGTASKIMFGTNGCCGGVAGDTSGTVTLPQGTISGYTSPTVVTVSFSGTSTACNNTACIFVWGSDDTTAIASAYTALLALGKDCGTLLLPAGKMLIQSAQFITAPTCTAASGTISNTIGASETIEGFGLDSTLLIPTPNFNFASCTGGAGSACFGGWRFAVFKDWTIWGAGNSLSGSNNSKTIVVLSTESYADKFGIVAWGGSDTSLIGLNASNVRVVNSIFRGAGQLGCQITAANTWFVNSVCTYNQNIALAVTSGSSLFSQNGFYGITNGATSSIQMTGNYYGWGDVASGNGSGATNTALVVLGGNTYLNGVTITCSLAAANALATNGGNAYATNSTFGGGSCNSVNRIANTYFDLGGNTYSTAAVGIAPACTFTSGGGTTPSCALQAGSTNEKGVIIASTGTGAPGSQGTVTLTFAGTFSGASGATPTCTYTLDNSGTAWGAESIVFGNTQSTTTPVLAWTNINAVALAALATSSPYRIDYTCMAR